MTHRVSRRSFVHRGVAAGAAAVAVSCFNGENGAPLQVRPPATPPPPSWLQVFGTQPELARLNRNENPYGPSAKVQQAIRDIAGHGARYATTEYLAEMIAEKNRIATAQLLISSGSVEGLTAACFAWGAKGAILCPDLFWDQAVRHAEKVVGTSVRRVRLDADLTVNLSQLEAAIDDGVSLIYLCNPNNPTGLVLDPERLRAFCRRVSPRVTILIDEAYIELTDEPERNSMIDLARDGHNVIVSRTFSKIYGMAGMRVGYMIGTPENLQRVDQYVLSWVGAPAVAAAIAAFDDTPFLVESKSKVIEARQLVAAAVSAAGLKFLPSQANFVYVDVVNDANAFQLKMRDRGVIIQGIYRDYPRWSRVSMGHMSDVERYVRVLPEVLRA